MSEELRARILTELARYTGKRVSAKFLERTSDFIPWCDRFHNLITGIYKPHWSDYALTIRISRKSPYEKKDVVVFSKDGRWLMAYSPRSGGLQHADNRSLFKCMSERKPIGVLLQLTDKTDRQYGTTYRVLGLGTITHYDEKNDVFDVEGIDKPSLEQLTHYIADEKGRYEVEMYSQVMNEFRVMVDEERVSYTIQNLKRDGAFRDIVVHEYDYACAVCEMSFQLDNLVEATAAHIVPKKRYGSDDPRNGLSLCHTHHWAFDEGLFAISDSRKVMLSPVMKGAKARHFDLLEMDGKSILLPKNEMLRPHPIAITWHRENIWRVA